MVKQFLCGFAAMTMLAMPAMAQSVDFGTDNGEWANDGECDDPRFVGAGMTATQLLTDDIMADATDCQTAWDAGTLTLAGVKLADGKVEIDFGTDNGEWANDNECDDPRFEGPGMTATQLLSDDILNDATDCRTAFEAGNLSLVGVVN